MAGIVYTENNLAMFVLQCFPQNAIFCSTPYWNLFFLITDDLGIAPDDIKMMKRNLLKRGIKAKAIKTFGQAGTAKGKKFGKKNGKRSSEGRVFGRPSVGRKNSNAKGAANAPFANDKQTANSEMSNKKLTH